jgi:pimeloyl-ACP methyl ester carboxylesterase
MGVIGERRSDQGIEGASVLSGTAVFVHGWGHSRIDMLAHMTAWRGRFARQVFYDLRGHGDAEGSLSKLGYREDEDMLALLERLGDGPFVLIAYSMGAVIALAAAAQDHPMREKIACVIVYAPYPDFHASLRGRMRRPGQPTRPMTDIAMIWMTIRVPMTTAIPRDGSGRRLYHAAILQREVARGGLARVVRGELSETVVLGHANKAHDGFVGHSYLGRWVNLGAGTITSNLKNTYGEVRVQMIRRDREFAAGAGSEGG